LANELVLGSSFYAMSVISMCIMLYLFKNGVAALDPNSTLSKQKSSTKLNKGGSDRLITRQESARSIHRTASRSQAGGNSVSGRTRGETDEQVLSSSPPSAKSTLAAPLNTDDEFEPKPSAHRDSEVVQDITHTHREVDALMSLGADLEQVHEEEPQFNEPINIELPSIPVGGAPTSSMAQTTSMVAPSSATVSPVQSTASIALLDSKAVNSSSLVEPEKEPVVEDVPPLSIN